MKAWLVFVHWIQDCLKHELKVNRTLIGFLTLTCPPLSAILFVSFSLWNETLGRDIQCSPVAGESGWGIHFLWISGSALPATIQRELWNLYRWSSAGTMSMNKQYFAFLFNPDTRILKHGNIRLKTFLLIKSYILQHQTGKLICPILYIW